MFSIYFVARSFDVGFEMLSDSHFDVTDFPTI